ncbi:succinyl-diaminopimelate desuccinylase [Evansella vedderi]|uniref:Probable succinyl-diaminopimelate desuccinylase n=1 Tax=Evansella vedderi TaxID=38282 RepID=A0ABT9ZNU5_9BACI|nr:M20 family metallopeptidase [Evansella vedderi]MDQ0252914.1 succinyl-diaminopimelate desuccinylase [Evansella vedderi]
MREEVAFLQKIIQANSSNPPGNELEVARLIEERGKLNGIEMHVATFAENRCNVEARLKGKGDKKLLLCGHMDTVSPGEQAWQYPPYSGTIVDNRLYGRGASDMKSGLAAMYLAFESLYKSKDYSNLGDIVFLATAGEEVDSCGAKHYLEANRIESFDSIIIGEPTNEKVVIGHKGALWLEIVTYGKTSHGAMPDQGINAIDHMTFVISMIKKLGLAWKVRKEPLGESSMAITKIGGGIQTNVIPDRCYIQVDIRSVPPQSHDELRKGITAELELIAEKYPSFRYEVQLLLDRAPLLTDPSSEIIQKALKLNGGNVTEGKINPCYGVSYYTDGSVLNPQSEIDTLIYGPGDEKLAHQPDEWVDIDAYLRSISFYKKLIVSYFQ